MSETQIKKLNLRALKGDVDTTSSKEVEEKAAENAAATQTEDKKTSWNIVQEAEKEKSDTQPSVKKISLKSMKKETDSWTQETEAKNEPQALKNSEKEEEKEENITKISLKKDDTQIDKNKDTETKEVTTKSKKKEEEKEENITKISLKKDDAPKIEENENQTEEGGIKNEKEEKKEENKLHSEVQENSEDILGNTLSKNANEQQKDIAEEFLKKINEEEQKELEKEQKNKKTENIPDEQVEFKNYESKFKKKSTNVLKRIQDFRYAPKTRKWLLLGLVGVTTCIVSGLMILLPEKHSVDIYKASILEIYQDMKNEENINSDTSTSLPTNDLPVRPTIEDNPIKTPVEVEPEDNDIVTEEEIEKKEERKEKIKQHILEKYKS